jgi:E3 ubiquitin-protein ligase HUWE1
MLHKYLAFKLVDSIGDSMVKHLTWERLGMFDQPAVGENSLKQLVQLETSDLITDKYGYWILMLSAVMSLLLDGVSQDFFQTLKHTSPQPFIITIAVITFKQKGGLDVVKAILRTFWDELQNLPVADSVELLSDTDQQRMAHAYGGIRIILSLFANLVSNKAVLHSSQSDALNHRSTADYQQSDYFNTSQLLVELRATILPIVQEMWESNTMERKATSAIVKSVVEIMGIILKGDHESSAFTRKDLERKPGLKNTISWKTMMPHEEQIKQLTDMGFSREAAADALLRCNSSVDDAATWLSSQGDPEQGLSSSRRPHRTRPDPMDEDDDEDEDEDDDGTDVDDNLSNRPPAAVQQGPLSAESASSATTSAVGATESNAAHPPPLVPAYTSVNPFMSLAEDDAEVASMAATGAIDKGKAKEGEVPAAKVVTVEDLEDLRVVVREALVDRSLNVLQVQGEITFELAELIKSALGKSSVDLRKEVASTIVQSLFSLPMDDDLSKTIAATAHLLGLILQEQAFYDAAVEDLNYHLGILIGFIKINHGSRAPWIANILLIVEKLLSENAQPTKIKFTPGQTESETVVEGSGVEVSPEDQEALFDAVVSILTEIDKEDTLLPLAVTRVLVLLTRRRGLATKMMQDGNLRKLFHMYRRQAGNNVDRLQPAILLLLRHIIEDDDTLRAVMKSEIRAQFASRPSRQMDTSTFTKNCSHLILRSPDVFIGVVTDLCKLARYDPHLRNQGLVLKEVEKPKLEEKAAEPGTSAVPKDNEGVESNAGPTGTEDKALSGRGGEKDTTEKVKTGLEVRPPGVERPDGVIHFLLMELFAVKDVKDFPPQAKEPPKPEETLGKESDDIPMENAGESTGAAPKSSEPTKQEKIEFKAENYPFFFYRCFILMTLMELLCCYNRCKVEFINFNRKANPREPITPSKPRSAIFNYLLHDIISQQSLTGPAADDIEQKTKDKLSQWAIHLFVSLCTPSGEASGVEEEADLLFVRKFFFEIALKAFRDACSSNETLDTKYARMASLGDLFHKVLSVRPPCASSSVPNSGDKANEIAKIMLEKNYISALTSALADVDLNYPNSRKVIKAMLKPLKLLSKTAVDLSETSGLSTPGATDEDEISTASSLSSIDDMREETPDLYRNSTLGLFEGGEIGDDDASSYDEDEDDEVMYDEEIYDEEDMGEGNGSDISEEDEDVEGGENMDVSDLSMRCFYSTALTR